MQYIVHYADNSGKKLQAHQLTDLMAYVFASVAYEFWLSTFHGGLQQLTAAA